MVKTQKVVVDSDIIIDFLRRGGGKLEVLMNLQQKKNVRLYVSTVTIAEIYAGRWRDGEKELIDKVFLAMKAVPFGEELAKFAGEFKRDKKLTITTFDFIIGMTAKWLDASLATRNFTDFRELGLRELKT